MDNFWFLGFDPDGGNRWASTETLGDTGLLVRISPARIYVGQSTRIVVEALDPSREGRTVVLTLSDPDRVSVNLSAVLARDAFGSVSAAFEVTGMLAGATDVSAAING